MFRPLAKCSAAHFLPGFAPVRVFVDGERLDDRTTDTLARYQVDLGGHVAAWQARVRHTHRHLIRRACIEHHRSRRGVALEHGHAHDGRNRDRQQQRQQYPRPAHTQHGQNLSRGHLRFSDRRQRGEQIISHRACLSLT
jgi:hypothetical protein